MTFQQLARGISPHSLNNRSKDIRKIEDHIRSSPPPTTASSGHSQAHRIFDKIYSYWNGLPPVNIPVAATFRVRRSEHHQLLQLLSKDEELQEFAFRRLKLYYNRRKRKLSYEMPTAIHEEMIGELQTEIGDQLAAIKMKSDAAKTVLGPVRYVNSSAVELPGGVSDDKQMQNPDGVWNFRVSLDECFPCFIFEVCFSQRMEAAVDKIRKVIFETDGHPGMALVVKLDYASPKQLLNPTPKHSRAASYTAFEWILDPNPQGVIENAPSRTIPRQQFRNEKGEVVPGKLSFSVRSFLGKEIWERFLNHQDPAIASVLDEVITIEHSVMAKWVEQVEATAKKRAAGLSSTNSNKQNLEKHYPFDSDADKSEESSSDSSSNGPDSSKGSDKSFVPSSPTSEQAPDSDRILRSHTASGQQS